MVIGEPQVTEFTSTNILQQMLIAEVNEAVHDLLEASRFRWGLRQDAFTTTDDLTTGSVDVTNGSTTVTSQDADGADADNFTNVAAGQWFRRTGDQTSYEVSSTSVGASPDTLTLADSYVGTTGTTVGYRIFQDTYSLSISDLDEITIATYGDSPGYSQDRLGIVDMRTLINMSGGDLHRDTSGKPRYLAEISPDSSNNPRIVLWPFPKDQYLIYLWYTQKFTSDTAFSTTIFGTDAPDIAYDAVLKRCRWRACLYDIDNTQAKEWWQLYERDRFNLVSRENRTHRDDQQMTVETYRRTNLTRRFGAEVVSQYIFDRE